MATYHLLSGNAKLDKLPQEVAHFASIGLQLAPANLSGHEVCQWRTKGCTTACLGHSSGRRVMENVQAAAIRRTKLFFEDRKLFLEQLYADIAKFALNAEKEGKTAAVRLNCFSDLDWEEVVAAFPHVQFYDYTKSKKRFRAYLAGELPANWHLTFSASERSDDETLAEFLDAGGNVAMVFEVRYQPAQKRIDPLPRTHNIGGTAYDIVDGDLHDIRMPAVDGHGVIVGLRLKGTNVAKSAAHEHAFSRGA